MKYFIFTLALILGLALLPRAAYAQEITINQNFSTDTVFNPFTIGETVYSLEITGSVSLMSDSSLVRVLVKDDYGYYYLLFEAYPIISNTNSFSFDSKCDETCYLTGIKPVELKIDLINSSVSIDVLKLDQTPQQNIPSLQAQAKLALDSVKILLINQNIAAKGYYWRAGKTMLQQKSYSDKEILFGKKYNIQGYEFYKGGLFQSTFTQSHAQSSSTYTDNFDWRNRHRSNIPNTPYYNSNGYGWITKPWMQSDNTCYAFASIGLEEAGANLFFNNNSGANALAYPDIKHQLDLNQSEMQIINCYVNLPCVTPSPYTSANILTYMMNNYVVNESCYPFNCAGPPCSSKCTNPVDRVKIGGFLTLDNGTNYENIIKETLIKFGPISCRVNDYPVPNPNVYHQMILVGYSTAKVGDIFYPGSGPSDPAIVLDGTCSFLGTTTWWFKDSYNGDFIPYYNTSNIIAGNSNYLIGAIEHRLSNSTTTSIKCSDEDGDGYYWWGLHWKMSGTQVVPEDPANCGCPPWVSANDEDCDDSDPAKGPYTATYECQDISSNCITSSTPIIINQSYQNKVWTTDVHINQNIIIEPQQVLEIKCNVYMSPNAKIIIKPQGILKLSPRIIGSNVYNSRISAGCGQFWTGIEINGDPGQDQSMNTILQYAEYQGKVIIDHGTIEGALCGIKTFNTGAIPYKSTGGTVVVYEGYPSGGIILASNALFLNNKIDIDLYSYKFGLAPNKSSFTNCTFTTDKNLFGSATPDYHIKFEGTNLVTLKGCTFSNSREDLATSTYAGRGRGIYSYNSILDLQKETVSNTPCSFSKLEYGIYGMHSGMGTAGIKLQNSTFSHCQRGTYISGYTPENNQVFTWNTFTNIYFCAVGGDNTYGLYLNNSSGFQVQNNNFVGNSGFGKPQYGVVVNNSGARQNYVYKNTFTSLTYALTGLNINRGEYALPDFFNNYNIAYMLESGLCFVCNSFSNNTNDICDTDEDAYTSGTGLTYYQKSKPNPANPTQEPAGNNFSLNHETGNEIYDILFDQTVRNIEYSYHTSSNILNTRLNPIKVNREDKITRKPINKAYSSSSCPDNFYTDGPSMNFKSQIAMADFKIDSLVSILKYLVDNGSTDSLCEKIMTSEPSESNNLYDDLMSASPYLSDTVLEASIQKETVLSNSLITDILVGNPQSAKSEEIMNTLDLRITPIPDSLYAEILDGKDVIGAREVLESELAGWIHYRVLLINSMIYKYLNDSLASAQFDSITQVLSKDYRLDSKLDLVLLYMDHHTFYQADSVLNEIPSLYDLTENQRSRVNTFKSLNDVERQMIHDSIGYLIPDSIQQSILQSLALNVMDLPGSFARNVLQHQNLISYQEPLTVPEEYKSAILTKKKGVKKSIDDQVIIYPNPCMSQFFIRIPEQFTGLEINAWLFGTDGKKVIPINGSRKHEILTVPMNDLEPGIYYLYIAMEGRQREVHKIIHIK
ncbi:MAG: hypothetical protein M0P47_06745 [Bacteroidales bacterium]|nr:hypothetical protein [Bacteroidales bacterium]